MLSTGVNKMWCQNNAIGSTPIKRPIGENGFIYEYRLTVPRELMTVVEHQDSIHRIAFKWFSRNTLVSIIEVISSTSGMPMRNRFR